jgi:peptidoglycan/xylan/chitin deacetylase (PgdA/CDA1 family)
MSVISVIKPLAVAFRGKGPATLLKRVGSIRRRYGLTAAKMDRALARLSDILKQFDCQATLPITAVALARNGDVIRKYQARGIEFAVHGYRHIDYSELALEEQCAHFRKADRVFGDQGIGFEGFRCPYLRENEHTQTALKSNGFHYESSASLAWEVGESHVTESYTRVLRFFGAQPARDYPSLPHLDETGDLVHIPYSLPDDEALVERLQWRSPAEMNDAWPAILRQTQARGELFTLGLHPERVEACGDALVATLRAARAASPAVWCAPLRGIAAWWKARAAAVVHVSHIGDDVLQLTVEGPIGTTLLLRSLDVRTPSEAWCDGYLRATELPCVVRIDQRPFIGIASNTAPRLSNFLKQQGYILEVSSNSNAYPLYLSQESFSQEDELPLLMRIEAADFALARLGRWPDGARSALAITGDIDALTLWDYGLRLLGK